MSGQRLHPDDLVGHLLEQAGWTHLNLPAIAEEDTIVRLGPNRSHRRRVGDLIHPERESQVALDELKASMGSMEFAAQYQQTPVPIGGNLIRWSWFKSCDTPPTPQTGDKIIASWDTALSSSQLADYSAASSCWRAERQSTFSMLYELVWSIPISSVPFFNSTTDGATPLRTTPFSSRRKGPALA